MQDPGECHLSHCLATTGSHLIIMFQSLQQLWGEHRRLQEFLLRHTTILRNAVQIAVCQRSLCQRRESNEACDLSLICEKIASASCKAAIKGNHKMTFDEAKALFEELMTLENPYNCPHGRPTLISMTKYEVEKRFKRIL